MKTNIRIPSRLLLTASAAVLCASTVIPSRVHAATLAYTVTDLGTGYAGGGISPSGLITGYDLGGTGFVRGIGTSYSLGAFDIGYAVNDAGQVAGYYAPGFGSFQTPYIWNGTTPTLLGGLGGSTNNPLAINAAGQMAGTCSLPDGHSRAVRWDGTIPTNLGTLGGTLSEGRGINASGQVAGYAERSDGSYRAVLWNGTTPTALDTLGGTSSYGYGINDLGQVVGQTNLPDGSSHAALWNGTTPTDLGTLPGQDGSYAYSVNDSGEVVGYVTLGSVNTTPFVYVGGTMYDLSSLLLPGSGVTNLSLGCCGGNLNDSGQIAAEGIIDGESHVLLLTPTPEPTSAVLLLGGGALLAFRRRKGR